MRQGACVRAGVGVKARRRAAPTSVDLPAPDWPMMASRRFDLAAPDTSSRMVLVLDAPRSLGTTLKCTLWKARCSSSAMIRWR
jgi:hypothetical protein